MHIPPGGQSRPPLHPSTERAPRSSPVIPRAQRARGNPSLLPPSFVFQTKKHHNLRCGVSSFGGDKRDRTADLLNAIQALSQLSYTPIFSCVSAADLLNIADDPPNVNPQFCIFCRKRRPGYRPPFQRCVYAFSLSFFTSFRLATTIPVRANRAMTLGRTIRLLNISVTSHTKSLPDTVPRKMNTRAIMV